MFAYVIYDTETETIVDRGGWTKDEAIKRAEALAKANNKSYEVAALHKVHVAKSENFDFEI